MRRQTLIAAAGVLLFVGIPFFMVISSTTDKESAMTAMEQTSSFLRRSVQESHHFNLAEQAQEWCRPNPFPPLHYHSCNPDDIVLEIPFMAGLTNGLKMMLLMVIKAFEENKCFYITEEANHLLWRDDKTQELDTFIGRYFEPIGLPVDHPIVVRARDEGRIERAKWQDAWNVEKRRIHGRLHNITSVGYENMESTFLKRHMLQRMWRLQPQVREAACATLESHNLQEDYLGYSVRRGDKDTEGFTFSKPEEYIEATEYVVKEHFDGKMPKIFVATDDCAVMEEFRALKPEWQFTSECDHASSEHSGFVLADMRKWTLEQTDEHYRKFYVELLGLAGCKFYIGVTYTNVAWWVHYMRPYRWSHHYLDGPTGPHSVYQILDHW